MPAARRPRTAPTSEPRASPSGFSCAATTTRGAARSGGRRGVVRRVQQPLTPDPRPGRGGGSTGRCSASSCSIRSPCSSVSSRRNRSTGVSRRCISSLIRDWIDGRTRSSAARLSPRLRLVARHLHVDVGVGGVGARLDARHDDPLEMPVAVVRAGSRRSPGAASRRRAAAAGCAVSGSWCVHRRHAETYSPVMARGGSRTERRSRSQLLVAERAPLAGLQVVDRRGPA